jgi:hypothetical protein
MEKFIKTPGRDPFIKTENESAIAMFGHLNALVDAINELEQSGGGGGGGNPVSIWGGPGGATEFTSAVQKITFTGNGLTVSSPILNEIIVNVPPFNINNISVNSIDLNKLKDISSQRLLGRYQPGVGSVETITLGTGLTLSGAGVLTASGATYNFDTSFNVTAGNDVSLSNTGVTAGIYGQGLSSIDNAIPRITVDAKGRVTNVQAQTIQKVGLTTGTISTAPATANDIVNKQYVDNLLQGLSPKQSVKAATTANISLVGSQTIDGVSVTTGNRVLVKDQNSPAGNGIYVVGSPWVRASDMNIWTEVPAAYVFVEQGTNNRDTGWVCTSDAGGTIDSTAINWVRFTGTSVNSYTGLAGDISINASNVISLATIPGLSATSYGTSTNVSQITVDSKGRVTSAVNTPINIPLSQTTGILPVSQGGTGFGGSTYTLGQILYASANNSLARLNIGSQGEVLTVSSSGIPQWLPAPTGFTNPLTTTGDILYRSSSSAAARLPIGSLGQFLRVSGGIPTWETVSFLSNPMSALGDMIVGGTVVGGVATPTRLAPATTNGHVLTYTSGGPAWQAATGGVTSVSGGSTGLTATPSTGPVVLTGTLNEVSGGTGLSSYAKGDILIADGVNSLTKLTVSSTANQVLTSDPSTTTGVKWATPTGGMSNPMTTTGDIIYGSTTGSPSTPARLAPNTTATDRFLRSNSSVNGGIPSWEAVPIQKTVVSFVIDGYGGPLTGSTTTVFVANIPFGASYNSFTIQGDSAPSGTNGTNTVTLAVNGTSTSITGSTISSNVTTPVINIPSTGGTLTFSLTVTGPSVATTKLFVNLTGTRS